MSKENNNAISKSIKDKVKVKGEKVFKYYIDALRLDNCCQGSDYR